MSHARKISEQCCGMSWVLDMPTFILPSISEKRFHNGSFSFSFLVFAFCLIVFHCFSLPPAFPAVTARLSWHQLWSFDAVQRGLNSYKKMSNTRKKVQRGDCKQLHVTPQPEPGTFFGFREAFQKVWQKNTHNSKKRGKHATWSLRKTICRCTPNKTSRIYIDVYCNKCIYITNVPSAKFAGCHIIPILQALRWGWFGEFTFQ